MTEKTIIKKPDNKTRAVCDVTMKVIDKLLVNQINIFRIDSSKKIGFAFIGYADVVPSVVRRTTKLKRVIGDTLLSRGFKWKQNQDGFIVEFNIYTAVFNIEQAQLFNSCFLEGTGGTVHAVDGLMLPKRILNIDTE